MVKQLNGEYRVKNEDLRPLYEDVLDLSRQFTGGITFVHVRRAQNKRADQLCNEALDGKRLSMRLDKPAVAAPPVTPPEPKDDLSSKAIALLRTAGTPSPEAVWKQLAELLREHWLAHLDPRD